MRTFVTAQYLHELCSSGVVHMKIENWERIDYGKSKVEWKHDTGVRILLVRQGIIYRLFLLDKAGITHYQIEDLNRGKLEAEAAKWQRDYNKHLRKVSLKDKYQT